MARLFRRFRAGGELRDELDRNLDRVVGESLFQPPPATLYLYTDWRAADDRGCRFLQVGWLKAGPLRNSPEHCGPDLFVLMEREDEVGPPLAGECAL